MAETNKKVLVSLPVGLLRQVDEYMIRDNVSRFGSVSIRSNA